MNPYVPSRSFVSWGRVAKAAHAIATPAFPDALPAILSARGNGTALAVGLGRSYGDSNLNANGHLIDMTRLDRVMAFDARAGILRAEAGLSLSDALKLIVPHGWFLPTTPGTRFVTLGGAVANDIHGKNHHAAGSFGCAVRRLGLLRSFDGYHELSRDDAPGDLFCATIGGMGLTGVIAWVELDLTPIASTGVDVEKIPFSSVRDFFRLADQSSEQYEHTVSWIDCASGGRALGRGIFQRANWRTDGARDVHCDKTRLAMPFDAPGFALNGLTVRAFNALYYRRQKSGPARSAQHYATYFYPLDAIAQWNRLYGARGFYQYQCVIPPETAEPAITELVAQIARAGAGSFLAVLKTLGPKQSPGLISFCRQGATLALDFPNKGARTLALLARLDKVVAQAGGRLYAAKDGRMPAAMFQAGYPGLSHFKHHVDPALSSDFWKRVTS